MELFWELLKSNSSQNKATYWDSNLQELFLKIKKIKHVTLPHKGSHFIIPKEIQQLLLIGVRKA